MILLIISITALVLLGFFFYIDSYTSHIEDDNDFEISPDYITRNKKQTPFR
ncbi:hypothetical protein [Seonamhaeicola algicola]|uniref:hypothetical protein n=1 Tax=Seonamhaeicola algicola TaxID=1719036 RepID=UPI00164AA232|nr:hypothetical protein [Seonamhaeicola algicola]